VDPDEDECIVVVDFCLARLTCHSRHRSRCEHFKPGRGSRNDCNSYLGLFTDSHAKPDLHDVYLVEDGGLLIENLGALLVDLKLRPSDCHANAASDMQAQQDWKGYESLIDR
jgi:hypothetical protein